MSASSHRMSVSTRRIKYEKVERKRILRAGKTEGKDKEQKTGRMKVQ
jgi:hypothetical protein